jgi:nitrogen fixation NifU-like protein
MSTEALYQEIILDHARTPRHAGLRAPYQSDSRQVNPVCGDEIELRLHVEDGRVADISYESLGCAISQASASMMTELLIGRPVQECLRCQQAFVELVESRGTESGDETVLGDAVAFAGVSKYPQRVKCALLAWMAWKDALTRVPSASIDRTGEGADHD